MNVFQREIVIHFYFFCDSDTQGDSNTDDDGKSVSLISELKSAGNIIDLPTKGISTVQGKVVDQDSDGIGDGLDLSGDGNGNLNYDITGYLNSFSKSLAETVVFTVAGEDTIEFYFILVDGAIAIAQSDDDPVADVLVIYSNGIVTGLDFVSTADVPVDILFISEIIPAFTETLPEDEQPYIYLAMSSDNSNAKTGLNNDFSDWQVPLGDGLSITGKIMNIGQADLELTGNPVVSVIGPDSAEFSVGGTPSDTVAPGDNTEFQLTFTPISSGAKTATLSIPSNAGDLNVAIEAIGTAPEIEAVYEEGIPLIEYLPGSTFDFGTLANPDVATVTFVITNTGTTDLVIIDVTLSGVNPTSFLINSVPDSSVPVDGTATVVVEYALAATLQNDAILTIVSNDAYDEVDESDYDINLSGFRNS